MKKNDHDYERNRNFKNNNYKGGDRNYKKKGLLDTDFDLEKSYFYTDLNATQLKSIETFIKDYFSTGKSDKEAIKKYFATHAAIRKGENNLKLLRKMYNNF